MSDVPPTATDHTISRIEIDRELCIGAASCMAITPDTFALDSEQKAIVKSVTSADRQRLVEAAKSCPVAAIYLYQPDGRRVYPV